MLMVFLVDVRRLCLVDARGSRRHRLAPPAPARRHGGFSDSLGLAYVAIVAVHTLLFMRSSAVGVLRAILTLAPYNGAAAVVIVIGGAS